MKRESFELGFNRLFHAAWGIGAVWLGVFVVSDMISRSRERMFEDLPGYLFGCVFLPLLAKYVGRWIYRGFFPEVRAELN